MDTRIQRRARWPWLLPVALFVIAAAGYLLIRWLPHGLLVNAADLQIVRVEQGIFRDDMVQRATAQPLNSIMLDAVESGRVEEVLVRDGAFVKKGELLFRLSNPQSQMALLQRQSEQAQQLSNLITVRSSFETQHNEHKRRMNDLQFELTQAQRQHDRNTQLAQRGFIASAMLDESADRLQKARLALKDEAQREAEESAMRRDSLAALQHTVENLQKGLQLAAAGVEALAVRAPAVMHAF